MALTDYSKIDLSKLRRVQDAEGDFVGDISEDTKNNSIIILPRSGANIRTISDLAIAVAQQQPSAKVGFDFSGNFYPVTATDTLTDVIIRFKEDGIGRSAPGRYLSLTPTGAGTFEGKLDTSREANIQLFDVLIDAIRLSRANGNRIVEFTFNQHRLGVLGDDTAEELEQMVPKNDRVTNVPPPRPQPKAEPVEHIGGFTIRGRKP